jgi:DNA invertase Pin-like site-specific DNA recombinase
MTTAKPNANRKFATKEGLRNKSVAKRVVALRNKGESWAAIAATLEIAPRTVRRIFDEQEGEGAHFASRIPGKGGRTRQEQAEA